MGRMVSREGNNIVKLGLIFLYLLSFISAYAQGENNNWVLGRNIGINFNPPNPPQPGGNKPQIFTHPTIFHSFSNKSAVSDTLGNLLFYTDGKNIYQRDFEIMDGGSGMFFIPQDGNVRQTLILKGACDQYIVVFVASISSFNTSVHYTVVDMSENGGLGMVVSSLKGVSIMSGSVKTIAASPGYGKIWLHIIENNESTMGTHHLFSFSQNEVKRERSNPLDLPEFYPEESKLSFSPDGTRFFLVQTSLVSHVPPLRYYSFDPENGNIEFLQSYARQKRFGPIYNTNVIQAIFSPNMEYAYILERYATCIFGPPCIANYAVFQAPINKRKTINFDNMFQSYFVPESSKHLTDIAIGPDNALYLSRFDTTAMDAILSPNFHRERARVTTGHLLWDNGSSSMDLPHMILKEDELRRLEGPLDSLFLCADQSINIKVPDGYDRVLWDDGDTSFERAFDVPGTYQVTLYQSTCQYEEEIVVLDVQPDPSLLPEDTTLCNNLQSITLSLENSFSEIIWEDGSNSAMRTLDDPGHYKVSVFKNGCEISDSFELRQVRIPERFLPTDTTLCQGDRIFLNPSYLNAEYEWSNGNNTFALVTNIPGTYELLLRDGFCEATNQINIAEITKPQLITTVEDTICKGEARVLTFPDNVTLSSDESMPEGRSFDLVDEGRYVFQYEDSGCVFYDSLNIVHQLCVLAEVYIPSAFSPNGDQNNDLLTVVGNAGAEFHRAQFSIFDRYGNVVWKGESMDEAWDGKINFRPAIPGVYVLVGEVDVTDFRGERTIRVAQDVTLIR